ncbi:MAG: AMP-binding protein, partial [Janthinobacterium lividum]
MLDLLRPPLAERPDAPLLIDAGPGQPVVVTRQAFWQRIAGLRTELADHGVGPGACIATWLPNWSDALVWQFAAVAAGAHVIGINTRYNVEEARHVLTVARPAVVAVAHDFLNLDLGTRLRAASGEKAAHVPSVAVVAGPRRPPPTAAECAAYDLGAGAWSPSATGDCDAVLTDDPESLAAAFTTSGSTGRPKLAAHKVGAIAAHARACADAGGWTAASVQIGALPLSGVFGYAPAMATIAAAGLCVLEPAFDVPAIVADMERYRVTHLV